MAKNSRYVKPFFYQDFENSSAIIINRRNSDGKTVYLGCINYGDLTIKKKEAVKCAKEFCRKYNSIYPKVKIKP